nr:MFS transporter [Actinoplanes derwentensis]
MLAALALCTVVIGLDTTVLSVALPTLAGDLGASTADLQWITTSYLLVLAATLLPAGMLGDRYGRKKLLLVALVIFGVASAACALAGTAEQLVAARAALGLGSAIIMSLIGAVLTVLFDDRERPRALTIWITANSLGIPLGPLLGGWLLDHFHWGSVFLINLPIVGLGLIAVAVLMTESYGDRRRRFDVPGILLSATGLVALTYGIIEAGEKGWSDRPALATIVLGVVALGALVLWQLRAAAPLIDLALFRNRSFAGGTLLATIAGFAFFGLLFALPQFFQAVGGADAFGTGLRLLPIIGGLMIGARTGEKLAARFGARAVIAAGLALIAGSLFTGAATTTVETGYRWLAVWITVTGIGLGLTLPTSMNVTISTLGAERSGAGNALIQAIRQVGAAIGVAVLGMVLNAAYRDSADGAGLPPEVRDSVASGVARAGSPAVLDAVRAAFTHGMDVSLTVAGAVAAAGVVLALTVLPGKAATAAE